MFVVVGRQAGLPGLRCYLGIVQQLRFLCQCVEVVPFLFEQPQSAGDSSARDSQSPKFRRPAEVWSEYGTPSPDADCCNRAA